MILIKGEKNEYLLYFNISSAECLLLMGGGRDYEPFALIYEG